MAKPFSGVVNVDVTQSVPDWGPYTQPIAPEGTPSVLYIVLDDVGYSAMGAYGGLIETPNIDRIAERGLTYTNFHTTALCSPTRSCLMTGRNHTTNGMATITEAASGFPSSNGHIPFECATVAEVLGERGWNTYMTGKWHLTAEDEMNLASRKTQWPIGRGFERFYGFLGAETNQWYPDLVYDNHPVEQPALPSEGYHLTTDLTDKALEFIRDAKAVAPDKPFFLHYCPGACHAPHHAPKEWIDKYRGQFDMGYEAYRELVFERQKRMGVITDKAELSPINPYIDATSADGKGWPEADTVRPWDSLTDDEKRLFARMAEVYAGFLSHADHEIGRLLDYLEQSGQLDNTIIVLVSDNGASGEGARAGRSTRTSSSTRSRTASRPTCRTWRSWAARRRTTTTRPAFGTSRQLVVAGTSASAVLVYSAVTALHPKDMPAYTTLLGAIVVSPAFRLDHHGVATVGKVAAGLPSVHAVRLSAANLWVLLPSAVGMMLVIFSEALGAAQTFADKHGYRLDPSQDVIALGLANIASGLLGGLAAGGSLSQTAVNDGAGARTELSPVIAAILSLVTVLALTGLFTNLPEAALAAMIIHAVSRLMKVAEMRRFYALAPREFWLGMITLLGVITLDVLPGLIIGVVASILLLIYRASRPDFSVLGRDPDLPGAYQDISRHHGATPVPGVLIIRPGAPLFYANAQSLRDTVTEMVQASERPIGTLIPDLDANDGLDITSSEALAKLIEELGRRDVRVALAHVHATTADMMRRAAVGGKTGPDGIFPNIDTAVAWAIAGPGDGTVPSPAQPARLTEEE